MTLPPHIELLRSLIATPSVSRSESATADRIFAYLAERGAAPQRIANNVYALAPGFTAGRPTLLLNSHHDTVRPAAGYTRNPYEPTMEGDRLYGLGSNDAGASAVALITAFLALPATLPFNVILAITAEEEVGGENGIRALLPHLDARGLRPDCAIVGEPTGLDVAIGERGLVVLDCVTTGLAGHAARGEGINAIYRAMEDIDTLRHAPLPVSAVLGPASLNITCIAAGQAHNAIPDRCTWVVDIRTTDALDNAETVSYLRGLVRWSELTPRSTRVRPSVIAQSHPLVRAAVAAGAATFVSPTTSDMSLLHDIPSIKIGPGQSARSHSADEFVLLSEIEAGINVYSQIISNLNETLEQRF